MRDCLRLLFAVSALLILPIVSADDCTPEGMAADCTMDGAVQIHSVDPDRFLVAVDAEPIDGKGDHLFLFTGAAVSFPEPQLTSGKVTFDLDRKLMEIERPDQTPLVIDFEGAAASHYWGYGEDGGKMVALFELREAATCDHVEGSCWEAEGWRVDFPL